MPSSSSTPVGATSLVTAPVVAAPVVAAPVVAAPVVTAPVVAAPVVTAGAPVTSAIAGALALLLLLAALALLPVAPADAEAAPPGTTWSETYIPTADGESLHVDVIHPDGFDPATQVNDVILVVSPYLGYTGSPGPVNRFYDLFTGAYDGEGVFANGWSVVQVSLRGTGGSTGCLDILGPGEQLDVVTAVEWVDAQPWADGIAMYGKSYDANTGAVAAAVQPAGLDAIIAQAIAPDRYRGSYNDRVRLAQSLLYPSATYGVAAEQTVSTQADSTYSANHWSRSADCQAGLAEHYLELEGIDFWRNRDFVERAEDSTIPTFITAGYLDNATNIGAGAVDLYSALDGPKALWVGWWAHDRGNDLVGGVPAVGRDDFFDAVEAFLEVHVRGADPADVPAYPAGVEAQSSDGTYRPSGTFPPAGAATVTIPLRSGSYADDGQGLGSADTSNGAGGLVTLGDAGEGVWTVGDAVGERTRVVGMPTATVAVSPTVPRANVVVGLYRVDADGRALLISRGAAMVDTAREVTMRMFPTDWVLEPGERLAVAVTDAHTEAYTHVPSLGDVVVASGQLRVPTTPAGEADPDAEVPIRLQPYLGRGAFPVPASADATTTTPAAVLR